MHTPTPPGTEAPAYSGAGLSPTAGLSGLATVEGTARYRDRHASFAAAGYFRPLADARLVSSIGLGTYLGEPDDAEDTRYRASVRAALAGGVNLVDTAINYRCQRSERAVGSALAACVATGVVRRDEVVLCTKGGFIPLDGAAPATRDEYRAYLKRAFFDPGILTPADVSTGGHSLAPSFLAHQIARSRANLGVAALDVYYLHNPEQQLEAGSADRFRTQVREAFALLEDRARRGEIGLYGCATWDGFRVPPGVRGHLSLQELVTLAREVGGDGHHFRVVQAPMSIAAHEAVRAPTQQLGRGAKRARVPLVEAAAELGVQVVASAPLMHGQLTRGLPPQLREAFPALTTDAQRAIAFVRAMPGVTAALVGMRSAEHVTENLEAGRA
ncbi:MAG: aldo/keto reductase [Gemmatimonadaceae bacterium]